MAKQVRCEVDTTQALLTCDELLTVEELELMALAIQRRIGHLRKEEMDGKATT